MRRLSLNIDANLDERTVLSVLKGELQFSTGLIARCKRIKNGITLDGSAVHTNVRVKNGQILSAVIGPLIKAIGEPPYEILYEDEDILIINKPAGTAAHGSRYDDNVDSIEYHLSKYFGCDSAYHPVSRLDKGTTGIMTIAKNGYMHDRLTKQLHSQDFIRKYIGSVYGEPAQGFGSIMLPIGRAEGSAIKREVRQDGAASVTHYEVLSKVKNMSVVRFVLETGRTHQIRVHMAAIGHPLVGDWLYGREERELIERPALHSSELLFLHPLNKKKNLHILRFARGYAKFDKVSILFPELFLKAPVFIYAPHTKR